jgi:pentatricopeptide repeat protein
MRRILVSLFFTFIAAIGFCSGVDNTSLYNEANGYYAAGEYDKALDLYNSLIERGIKNHLLYYNTANTYFKLGETGYARLFYERALLLNPFDRDVRNNLGYLQNSLKEKIVPLYNEGIFRAFFLLSSFITERILGIIEIVFFTAFIIAAHYYLFFPSSRDRTKRLSYTSLSLFVLFFLLVFAYHSYEKNHPKGVVVYKSIDVLSAPVAESELSFKLYEGTKMKLKEARGEWIRISISDGRDGWIQRDLVEFI